MLVERGREGVEPSHMSRVGRAESNDRSSRCRHGVYPRRAKQRVVLEKAWLGDHVRGLGLSGVTLGVMTAYERRVVLRGYAGRYEDCCSIGGAKTHQDGNQKVPT